MPSVTVIMPVYNGEAYLQQAIESILQQSLDDFEFLIINDGSTDRSEQIILASHDRRIRYLTQENQGLTKTLNRLIREAQGGLLARMDQDDWSHPRRLEMQAAFLTSHPEVKICGSWIRAIDTKNALVYEHRYPVTNHAIHEEMLISNPFAHGSVMIRTGPDVFYRTEYNDAEDVDHWARQCRQYAVANIPTFLYHWRVNPAGITHSRVQQQQAAAKRVRKQYAEWYLQLATAQQPPIEEMRRERKLTGFWQLWRRKRALMKLFSSAGRPDLVKREWTYLRTVIISYEHIQR